MSKEINTNTILKWDDSDGKEKCERVLWIDENRITGYTIDILAIKCVPKLFKMEDVVLLMETSNAHIMDKDPLMTFFTDEDIPEKRKELRDKAWTIISDIALKEPEIYERFARGKLIEEQAQTHHVSEKVIYKYLRKYWQRGKNKNALLPDYSNSGGKGKAKTVKDKKIGRPRRNPQINGEGIVVDDETKRIFKVAINKFYNTPKETPLTTVYEMMLKEFYAEDYRILDGIRKPMLIPTNEIPSMRQFQYWFNKEKSLENTLRKRKGDRNYELKYRAITGRSDTDALGPGSIYQIDATVGDVYLVSRYNRNWIIGRPVIYVVIDVFSRMIVGVYVGLEGPSWTGAMMALANVAADKVSFCGEYGITITEDEWPCRSLPQAILGDRGELEGKMPETMINSLGVRIDNTPPYRADWKGIVEQHFRILNTKVRPFLPGFVFTDFNQRGGKDYRLDSKLDIYQLTQIILKCVLNHNNSHWMDRFIKDEMMIADDVNPIPCELWQWGIENRSGKLKVFPEDIVKLNLMPTGKATVTASGIKFKNMYYSSDKALQERWFEKARNDHSWKEDISYDPRNMNRIYIRNTDGRSFEQCFLIDNSKYSNKTLDEILYLDEVDKQDLDAGKGASLQAKVDLMADIEYIVEKATKMTNEQTDGSASKASKIKGIKTNRRNEKLKIREKEAFTSGDKPKNEPAQVIDFSKEDEETYDYSANISYLKKKQKERLNGKHEE